ncbi:MAG: hypothetical protein MK081_15380 [Flavobacteriales bacterium]|nr:hypothetical protein [Flavobacteriales bacterium]
MYRKRVMYAVLDWGLGHATRSVPLIERLIEHDVQVFLAGNGSSLEWLAKRFPDLEFLEKPGKAIRYSKFFNTLKIAQQAPSFLASALAEKEWTQEMVRDLALRGIISDNCYGIVSEKCPSVLISHQLNLPVPSIMRSPAQRIIKRLTANFNEVWIPDLDSSSALAGKLSHPDSTGKGRYIGLLSQFEPFTEPSPTELLGMVSGPEPHRTLMQEAMVRLFEADTREAVIVTGKPGGGTEVKDNVTIIHDPEPQQLAELLSGAQTIICRSGYSSLMDLATLGKRAVIIPTPGQPEQEFLADHWAEQFGFTVMEQKQLEKAEQVPTVTGTPPVATANTVATAVLDHFIERL